MLESKLEIVICRDVKFRLQFKNYCKNTKVQLKVDRKKHSFNLKLNLKGGTSNEVWRKFI